MIIPEQNILAIVDGDNNISIWNKKNKNLVKKQKIHDNAINAILYLENKKWIITASDDMTIKVFTYPELELL